MAEKKLQQLLENLSSTAAEFAYDAKEQNFSVKVLIDCQDGWVYTKKI